jgi:hypothetical protein
MIKVGEGFRLYRNTGDRRRAVAYLKKKGFNYFVGYKDTHSTHPAGLSFGQADWVGLYPYERDVHQKEIVH